MNTPKAETQFSTISSGSFTIPFGKVLVLFSLCIFLFSCQCTKVDCMYGKCKKGVCECDPGYESSECDVASIDKFVGSYLCTQACDTGPATGVFTIEISGLSVTERKISLYNLLNYGIAIEGIVVENTISITRQPFNSSQIEGTGLIDVAGGIFTLDYTLIFPDYTTRVCSANLSFN